MRIWCAIIALVLGVSGMAWAQLEEYSRRCLTNEGTPDLRAQYCTRVIQSGQFSREDLAYAYFSRGIAYYDKDDYDRAIQDYTEAIRLDPKQADFFMCRGIAYHRKGDYDRAIQDFTVATRVTSKEAAWGYRNRGTIRFEQGQLQDAGRDLAKALEIDPTDHPAALDLYLVQMRAGQDARGNLAKAAQRLDLREWPGPVVSMYLGKSTAEAVFKAASANPDPEERRKQQCHAAYYIGHQLLAQGAKADAVKQLQWVASACAVTPFAFSGAKAELRRLGN